MRKRKYIKSKSSSYMSVKSISKEFGYHSNTIRAWVNRDKLRCVRKGKGNKIHILREDVQRFIDMYYND